MGCGSSRPEMMRADARYEPRPGYEHGGASRGNGGNSMGNQVAEIARRRGLGRGEHVSQGKQQVAPPVDQVKAAHNTWTGPKNFGGRPRR